MKILQYFNPQNFVKYISQRRDINAVKKSIIDKMRRKYADMNVGEAVHEIWEGLDIALLGANREYSSKRVRVVRTALEELSINKKIEMSVRDYLQTAA